MNRTTAALFLIAMILMTAAFSLSAQSADGVISVVVTADRTETEETKTGAMVTVITAEEIADSGAADLPALLEALPGVQFRSTAGPAQAQISMGGFGEGSFGRVVVMVDGKRLNNPDMSSINWQSIPVDSIERIEVLHGGGSVLYGSGAIGGVVNIITKKAVNPFSVTASSSWGSFNTFKEALSLGLSGGAGELRIGGDWYSTDGHRDRTGQQSAHATLGGSLYPDDNLALGLDLAYSYNFYEMPGGLTEAQFEADPSQAVNLEDESTEHTLSADLSGGYALGDAARLDVVVGYEYKKLAPNMASFPSYTDRFYNTLSFHPQFELKTECAGKEIVIVSGLDSRYAHLDAKQYADKQRTTESNAFTVSGFAAGAFSDLDIALSDAVSVSGGFRYSAANIAAVNSDESVKDDKWHLGPAWSAGLLWNPSETSKLYFRHEGLFRYPFTDEQASLYGFGDAFLTDLEAEKGYLFEAGGMLASGSLLRVEARGYLNLMQDEIAYNSAASRNENMDNTRRLGAEVKTELKPSDLLKVNASYGYVLPTFTNGDNEGKQIPLVSNHEAEASLIFFLPFGLELETGTSWRSESYQGGDNANAEPEIDAYLLYDAVLRWKQAVGKGDLALSCSLSNITDASYAPLAYYSSWFFTSSYYPAPGRSFTLSGSYTY